MADVWARGEPYEAYVGRWSRLAAGEFVEWLAVPEGAAWLDVGCGTGALTELVLARAGPASVTGVDPSEGFLEFARAAVLDGRASFAVGDAQELPFADGSFDAAVAGLVLNFVPEPAQAAREMVRATRAGGVVAAYVWDYGGDMQMMRHFWDAAGELDPRARELDEGQRFSVARPDGLASLVRAVGLADVETRPIDVPTSFRDFDDYWRPFLGGQGPAPAYLSSLAPAEADALREAVRARVPIASDGSIRLLARAWAVKGRVDASAG